MSLLVIRWCYRNELEARDFLYVPRCKGCHVGEITGSMSQLAAVQMLSTPLTSTESDIAMRSEKPGAQQCEDH